MIQLKQLSYWERKSFFEDVDFLVVGAGIVGYSTALNLKKKYKDAKILIIERGFIPSGASSKNAGFACFGSVSEIVDDLSKTSSSVVWDTVAKRWEGLKVLTELIGMNSPKTIFGYQRLGSWDLLMPNQGDLLNNCRENLAYINVELERITKVKNCILEDTSVSTRFGFAGLSTSFYNCLEGQLDTGKMNKRFYQLAIENDIDVLFGVEVLSFESYEDKVHVQTSIGEFDGLNVLICTNGFAPQLIDEDVVPARAQVLVTSPIQNLKIKGTFHYDCGYYYFRNVEDRILLGGGRNLDFEGEETTKLETTQQIVDALKELLSSVIIPHQAFQIEYQWAGIMGVGKTKQPIVKLLHHNVGVGVRLGGMGVAIGSLVGQELADMF